MLSIGARKILHFIKAINSRLPGMKTIKTAFIANEEVDDHAGSQAYCKTEDIDECVHRTLPNVAKSDQEVVFDHEHGVGYTYILQKLE